MGRLKPETLQWLLWTTVLLRFLSINGKEWLVERVGVLEMNHKFLENISFQLVSYSRRKRVVHLYAKTLETLNSSFTVNNVYEEFMYNEYRPVFVGLQFNFCDFLEAPYAMLKQKFGLQCPLKPNVYNLPNLTVQWDLIPNYFPFKRGRIICSLLVTATGEVVGSIVFYTHVL